MYGVKHKFLLPTFIYHCRHYVFVVKYFKYKIYVCIQETNIYIYIFIVLYIVF